MNLSNELENLEFLSDTTVVSEILKYVDLFSRIFACVVHVVYFVLLIRVRTFRTRTTFFMHHLNATGFLYCAHTLCYFIYAHPKFESEHVNDFLCTLSEILWGTLKYLRSYSLLQLGLYRFVGVFDLKRFKLINKSNRFIVWSTASLWVGCIGTFLITKLAFQTTFAYYNCMDGYSISTIHMLGYLLFSSILSIILPMMAMFIILFMIRDRLKLNMMKISPSKWRFKLSEKKVAVVGEAYGEMVTNRQRVDSKFDSSSVRSFVREELTTQQRLIKKMLLLNVCYLLISISSFLLYLKLFIIDFYFLRQIARIVTLLVQSFIPIISILYYWKVIILKYSRA